MSESTFPSCHEDTGSGFWPTGTEGLEWITFLGKVNPQQRVYNTPWALKYPGVEVAPSFLSDTKNLELPQASVASPLWSHGTSQRIGQLTYALHTDDGMSQLSFTSDKKNWMEITPLPSVPC